MGPVAEISLSESIARLRKTKPTIDKIVSEIQWVRENTGVYSTIIEEELGNLRRDLTKIHDCLWIVLSESGL